MIGQQIALNRLVPLALDGLQTDPLVEGDYYPGDLLASVLRVDAAFWKRSPDLEVERGRWVRWIGERGRRAAASAGGGRAFRRA